MASGLSGQNFAFNGYLPIDAHARAARLKQLEQRSGREASAQMFIETPFRNVRMFEAVLGAWFARYDAVRGGGRDGGKRIYTYPPGRRWRKEAVPDIDKRPTVFIIQK